MASEMDLFNNAVAGDRGSRDLLFKQSAGIIEAVFLSKICKSRKGGQVLSAEGLGELCKEAFDKAFSEAVENRAGVAAGKFDWFKHCRATAAEFWKGMAQRANEGDQVSIDRLVLVCRRPLMGFLKAHLRPVSGLKEGEYYDWIYVMLRERIAHSPYDPLRYSLYSYLKYIAKLTLVEKRIKAGGKIELPFKGNRGIYRDPREIRVSGGSGDPDSATRDRGIDLFSDHSDPEALLIAKQEVILHKRSIETKLATLRLCAEVAKPHQFFAFGFNKWLDWKTERIVDECGDEEFDRLFERLFESTRDFTYFISDDDLNECFSPLVGKLKELTRTVYKEREYKKLVEEHGDEKVAKLTFKIVGSYYNHSAAKNISDWTDKVKKAMWNALNLAERKEDKSAKRKGVQRERTRNAKSKRI